VFELDDARRDQLIEAWDGKIVNKGLATAAVFMIEAHKPVAGIGAHAALAFQPLLGPLLRLDMGELAAFMHGTDNLERLLQRIEGLERERTEAEEARRRRAAEIRRRARCIRQLRRQRR
jgi:hypothetical protein